MTTAIYVVIQIVIVLLAAKVGSWSTLYTISSRLRKLPLYQESFEYLMDNLGLDNNPLDRRTRGEE